VRLLWFSDRTWRGTALAAGAALRLFALGRADLSTDEIQTLHAVRLPWAEMVRERLAAGHAPLWFAIEKAWTSVAGTTQFALRLPSALAGLALLVPAWSLLRRLAGESAAWWGTALLAFHPLLVEHSREARMYALLVAAVLVVADGAAAALEGQRPGAAFWGAAVSGPLIHPTWGVALLPLLAWLAAERRQVPPSSRRPTDVALAGVAASLVLLTAALAFATPQHQELTRRPWPREIGVFALRIFAGSDLAMLHSFLACAAVVCGWGCWLVAGLLAAVPRTRRLALAWGLGVPFLAVAAGVLGGVPWGPARYVAAAALGFSLLATAGMAAHAASRGRESSAPLLLLVCLVLAAWPLAAPSVAWSDAANALRGDPSPVVVDDEPSRIVLAHYLGRDVFVGSPPPGAAAWRHASLAVADGRREVRIESGPRPR
jgi:hypothetical protein